LKTWLTRIRGAIGMGLTWAAGWVFAGVLIGVMAILLTGIPWEVFEVFDAPLPALAIPGFFGGAVFSAVLGIAGRRHRFDELSLPRFAAWGALGGVLVSLIPGAMVVLGLARAVGASPGPLQFTAAIVGPLALLSAGSAAGSLMLARKSEDRALLEASADVAEVGLTGDEARELLDSGT
jgi:hypothetical protein